MKVMILVYEETKYTTEKEPCARVEQEIADFRVEVIPEEEILKHTDGSCVDEYNEYLIITYPNGDEGTFRNSHCDIFRI